MRWTILVLAGALAACASDSGEVLSSEITATDFGQAAYNEHCAGCHETGMLGAPVAGDPEDWGSRSQLWDAVLLDHAITGYLEMPAKGGKTDLPDDVVKAAADYMLEITYPDRPQDCNPAVCGEGEE